MTDMTQTPSDDATSQLAEETGKVLRVHAARSAEQLHELETELVGLNESGTTIQEDRDGARRLIESVRADLIRTERAIERIDSGTYGQCTSCGKAIGVERLTAIPEAELCTGCA